MDTAHTITAVNVFVFYLRHSQQLQVKGLPMQVACSGYLCQICFIAISEKHNMLPRLLGAVQNVPYYPSIVIFIPYEWSLCQFVHLAAFSADANSGFSPITSLLSSSIYHKDHHPQSKTPIKCRTMSSGENKNCHSKLSHSHC